MLFFLKKEKLLLEKQLAWEQSKISQTLHTEHTACVKVTCDKVATHCKGWRKEKVAWSLSYYLQLWCGKVLYCHMLTNLWTLERKCKNQDLHLYFIFRFRLWSIFSIFETTEFDSHPGLISNMIAFAKLSWNVKGLNSMCGGSAQHFCVSFAVFFFLNKHKVYWSSVAIVNRLGAVPTNK